MHAPVDLSVVIPAFDEAPNLAVLLPQLREVLDRLQIRYEVLIVTPGPDRESIAVSTQFGARVLEQVEPGYGGALRTGFATAQGAYLATMDADLSHRPIFLLDLWSHRHDAEVLIASRYVAGGSARMPWGRYLLSRILNSLFSRCLALPIRDLSSGFRLYNTRVLRSLAPQGRDFDILPEILVKAYSEGFRVREIPFHYAPRRHGQSHARIIRFGLAYLKTLGALWRLRNSILSGDYDDRAYDSRIPFQRYWQRKRFRYVKELIEGQGAVLDVGCGSSRIIGALPPGSVALDIQMRKLRHARKFSKPLVQGSILGLPFADGTFPCVLCSEVIEHVPKVPVVIDELCRVLAPGGRLVLGTPDYSRWEWRFIESLYRRLVPGGYADEHIAHYTRRELTELFERRGFTIEAVRYIGRSELILALRKPR
ncbi:MAG: methyltransferase domain-containing protein [Acidobacteria bacterium]|nr:methyltransferase domain-containing protein [Acidobacteriota bacterium]MDW7983134.1 methyltransferase domain-containing protein [Acidobacteriota bacterium]